MNKKSSAYQPFQPPQSPFIASPITSETNQPPPPTEIPTQKHERKFPVKIFAIVGGLVVTLLVVGLASYFLLLRPRYTAYDLYFPESIPAGFSWKEETQIDIGESGNNFFIFEFNNPEGKSFLLAQEKSAPLECKPPPLDTDLLSNYSEFMPTGAQSGCVVTINKNTGEKLRVYRWILIDTRFQLLAYNLSISDSQAMELANSLKQERIEIGEVIEE